MVALSTCTMSFNWVSLFFFYCIPLEKVFVTIPGNLKDTNEANQQQGRGVLKIGGIFKSLIGTNHQRVNCVVLLSGCLMGKSQWETLKENMTVTKGDSEPPTQPLLPLAQRMAALCCFRESCALLPQGRVPPR
jgi:hypothetical protein